MIRSKCEPVHNRCNALMTYLVLQTFLVFHYLSVVHLLSRSSSSFSVREDKDNVWQDEEAHERLCGVLFRPMIPFTQVLSTTKKLGNACGRLQGREKEKKVLIASANSMKWKFPCLSRTSHNFQAFKPIFTSWIHKNSLDPRRPAHFSFRGGVLFSHLFVRKRQHGSRRYAMFH